MTDNLLLYSRDPEFTRLVKQISQKEGYRLAECESLVEFVNRLLDTGGEVLVLDFRRVNAGVLSWLTMIRRLRPRLPMIVATDAIPYELEKQIHQMMVFYLAFKPVSMNILQDILRAAVRFSHQNNPATNVGRKP